MLIYNMTHPTALYETPDLTGGGGGQALADPPAQPNGQGPGQPQETAEQFWGLFPNVPEEHRELLAPHIREMQSYITRLEGERSPLKQFLDAGYTPDQLSGVFNFASSFDQDPLGTWIGLGQMLQQADDSGQSLIHQDVDFDILAKIARGEDIDETPAPQLPVGGQGQLSPEMQQLLSYTQQLEQRLAGLEGTQEQQTRAQREAAQQRLLKEQFGTMRQTLTQGGFPEEGLTEEVLRGALIASNGNTAQAIKILQDARSAILKGFTSSGQQPGELELNGGTPPTRERPTREPRDGFEKARSGAMDFLKRQNRGAAQGT